VVGVELESLRDSSVTKPERNEILIANGNYVIYIIHCGSKCLRCQDIASIEASLFGGKVLQIWKHLCQQYADYEENEHSRRLC
jgi:hypothetical protein